MIKYICMKPGVWPYNFAALNYGNTVIRLNYFSGLLWCRGLTNIVFRFKLFVYL